MQLEAADWSIQATPPVHLQGFTPTCVQYWKAANRETVATQDGKGQHGGQASPSAHGEKVGFSAQGKSRHGGEQFFE